MKSSILWALLGAMIVTVCDSHPLTERLSSWVRDVGSAVDNRALRPVAKLVEDTRHRVSRDSAKDHVSFFVKRVESLLDRLVPNKNFVQDLMGIPEPEASSEMSQEINSIIKKSEYKPRDDPNLYANGHKDVWASDMNRPAKTYRPYIKAYRSFKKDYPAFQRVPDNELYRSHPDELMAPKKHSMSMYQRPGPVPQEPPSMISKLPIMLHNFADDWFRRNE